MTAKLIDIKENGLHVAIEVDSDGDVRLVKFQPLGTGVDRIYANVPENAKGTQHFRLVEVQAAGFCQHVHHGPCYKGTEPGSLLRYVSHKDERTPYGRLVSMTQHYEGLYVTSNLQFFDGIPVVRSWTELENKEEKDGRRYVIEYVSSFALTGLETGDVTRRDEQANVYIPHNTWFGEAQWKKHTLNELGYDAVNWASVKRVGLSETGTWATCNYLPMGAFENLAARTTFSWQIETSGSWSWEISDKQYHIYIQLSGPSSLQNGFTKILCSGQRFESVPCAVACVNGGFEESIQALTKYRRVIRRLNKDNEKPSIIFNDYMNCLMGNPSTAKLIPLIDAAAAVGSKYFCIDCGWYDDGPWWDGVGEWLPAKGRFPNGIRELLDYIRSKGMIPGLWLELEVMGIKCPMAGKVSKDWFFQRYGEPIIDESRYQLDYRNPEVRDYATAVVRRLVEDYGVGYIKMDYNIDPGVGTDLNADSAGEGLFEHKRAYLAWLDAILKRYPDLVFENCSSGGMRMEYSMLSRCSIQSVTDQEDYLKMAAIAANCMTAVTPEQAAIWSYPLRTGDAEEVIFNMVNAVLLRVHQSGHLSELSAERFALVKEGLEVFASISCQTSKGLPIWPTGLASFQDNFISVGIDCGTVIYVAVWCVREDGVFEIPLQKYCSGEASVTCIYPKAFPTVYTWRGKERTLTITMQAKTARLFSIRQD